MQRLSAYHLDEGPPGSWRGPRRRNPRRAAMASVAAAVVAWPALTFATPAQATTTTPTTPPTTTPPTTPPTTAAPAPPPPTPPRTASPTTVGPGVPAVPTGGSAAKAPSTAAPAASAGPIISAVQADLDQLQAINQVAQVRIALTAAQQAWTAAGMHLADTQAVQSGAAQGVAAAQGHVHVATSQLSALAVAAYTGAAYATPQDAPTGDPGQIQGGAFGLTAQLRLDASELIHLITNQERRNLGTAKKEATAAKETLAHAGDNVAQARGAMATADSSLAAAKHNLTQTLQSATVTGAALANQGGTAGAPSTTIPSGAGTKSAATGRAAAMATGSGAGSAAGSATAQLSGDDGSSPRILGPSTMNAAEIAGWFVASKHAARASVPITQLAVDYLAAGRLTGVRADLAFAQSVIETGYFSFPTGGQLVTNDNNFAGIGACDSCAHGWTFPDAITGVTAQLELLQAYASPNPVPTPLVGPVGVGGCCQTWMALAGKWATDPAYGISILTVYKQMLDYAIPEQLVVAGLAAPGTAPPLPAVPAPPPQPPLPATLPSVGPATTAVPKAPTLAPTAP